MQILIVHFIQIAGESNLAWMREKKRRAHEGEVPHISPVVLHQLNLVIERVVFIEELLEQFQLGVWYLVLKKEGDLKQENKTVGN